MASTKFNKNVDICLKKYGKCSETLLALLSELCQEAVLKISMWARVPSMNAWTVGMVGMKVSANLTARKN